MLKRIRTGLTGLLGIGDAVCCFVLGGCFAAAPSWLGEATLLADAAFFLSWAGLWAGFLLLFLLLRWALTRKACAGNPKSAISAERPDRLPDGPHSFWLQAGILFACWLVVLLLLYPGTLINDTWGQLKLYRMYTQAADKAWIMNTHHPVLDTFWMGSILWTLSGWIGWEGAVFVYVLVQAAGCACAVSYLLCWCGRKLGLGKILCRVLLAVFCLLPLFPLTIQTVSKDAFSVIFFLVFCTMYMEAVRTRGKSLGKGEAGERKRIPGWIPLTAFGVLSGLTKSVNAYVVAVSLALLFLAASHCWRRVLAALCCFSFCLFLAAPVVYDWMAIGRGGRQEMFSLPFQMTARYVRDYGDDMTDEERQAVDKLLDLSTLAERYNPVFADPVKGYTERGTAGDYLAYLKAFLSMGLKHPGAYFQAAGAMLSGWFSFAEYAPITGMGAQSLFDPEMFPASLPYRSGWSAGTASFVDRARHGLYDFPVTRILFTYGVYGAILPAFALVTCLRRGKKKSKKGTGRPWVALCPLLLALVLGCFLAPASANSEGWRYLTPLVFGAPGILAWSAFALREKAVTGRDE